MHEYQPRVSDINLSMMKPLPSSKQSTAITHNEFLKINFNCSSAQQPKNRAHKAEFTLLKQLAHDCTRTHIMTLLNLKKRQLDVKVTNIVYCTPNRVNFRLWSYLIKSEHRLK